MAVTHVHGREVQLKILVCLNDKNLLEGAAVSLVINSLSGMAV